MGLNLFVTDNTTGQALGSWGFILHHGRHSHKVQLFGDLALREPGLEGCANEAQTHRL